jgi:hypothetical protein
MMTINMVRLTLPPLGLFWDLLADASFTLMLSRAAFKAIGPSS